MLVYLFYGAKQGTRFTLYRGVSFLFFHSNTPSTPFFLTLPPLYDTLNLAEVIYVREVTRSLISDFHIKELGYDFMGYSPQNPPQTPHPDIPTYHHLLIPRRHGGHYSYENGVILYTTPHAYLHVIESLSPSHFYYITSEMFDMKIKQYLDPQNLHNIDDILQDFEATFSTYRTKKRTKVLKPEYLNRHCGLVKR